MGYRVEEDPEHSKGKKYAFKMTPLTAAEKGKKAGTLKGKGGKVSLSVDNLIWMGSLEILTEFFVLSTGYICIKPELLSSTC